MVFKFEGRFLNLLNRFRCIFLRLFYKVKLKHILKSSLLFHGSKNSSLKHVLVVSSLLLTQINFLNFYFNPVPFIFHLDQSAFDLDFFLNEVNTVVCLVLFIQLCDLYYLPFDNFVEVLQLKLDLLVSLRI